MSMPALFLIISIIRCGATPTPALAKVSAPGVALGSAITSANEIAPHLGRAVIDHEAWPEPLGEFANDDAGGDVVRPAGRIGHHHPHRAIGVGGHRRRRA